ncbi:MAG: heparan N-sulfatase [Rhodopirellula sp.]|nr:heparan N-sulfatase [Rhodopirellula sp.]
MKRFFAIFSGLLLLVTPAQAVEKANVEKPNIVMILADDCTHNDLPMYGGQNARTPNLEQLATEGLVFNRAYLAEAMCQPCRAELYSGLYPMRNGCAWNHSACLPETLSMPHYLGALGYRVGLAGKVHVLPKQAFPFERVSGFDANCVRNPTKAHELSAVNEFLQRDKQQPFCLVVALVEPHVPWVMGDASAYPPGELELPPNIADTKLTREAFSRYLAEITYMDSQVGELLNALNGSGQANNTLVLFSSEQGSQFPGNKWTNWDTGVHTALIARWPGVVPVGARTDAMVQFADVLPTLLDVAGSTEKHADAFDGRSFFNVLKGKATQHRKYVYGVHNNVPEGPPYPVRTISDGTYRYVRNLRHENLYIEKHLMGVRGDGLLNNPYWQTWVWDSWESPETYKLVQRYMNRPAEALYHTASDPYELKNLVGTDNAKETHLALSRELDRWLISQGDPGIEQDTPASHQAAKRGEHRFRAPMVER